MSEVMTGILEGAGFTAAGDNRFKFKATKVGAKAKNKDGVEKVWSAAMLSTMHPTWKDKTVSINHNGANYGKIVDTEYDGTFVYHTIDVQPWLAGWIRRNPNHIGVSIESTGKWNEAGEIIEAAGTGVTIVLPPYVPVCSLEEGCGYFAGATDKSLSTAAKPADKGEKMSDKTEDMIAAEVALKAEIKALNDKLVAAASEKSAVDAELTELRAFKAKVEDKERGELLAALTGYLGEVDAYKNEHICVLRKMVSSCEAAVKKFEAAKLQTSGADVKNEEKKGAAPEAFPGYTPEEVAEYKAAQKIADSVGIKL